MPELKTIFSLDERLPWISGAEYEFFVQVVELSGEQSREAMGLSNPSRNRQLAALERRLGAQLIGGSNRRQSIAALQRP